MVVTSINVMPCFQLLPLWILLAFRLLQEFHQTLKIARAIFPAERYWKRPYFLELSTEAEFHLLLRSLHFDNKSYDENTCGSKRVYKLEPVFHHTNSEFRSVHTSPVTIKVVALSEEWTVFARYNTGVVISNLTRGMDVCLRLFCVLSCADSGLTTGWSSVHWVIPTV
jgi:hypothetical protein